MKGLALFLTLTLPFGLLAQGVNEGTFFYDIQVISSDNKPELARSLEGATLTLYLKPNQSRSEMKSKLGSESSIFDNRTGNGFILKEYSGQKLMITMTRENWAQKNQLNQSLKFNILPGETEINGFKVKQAVATRPDGKEVKVYFSSTILPVNKQYNNAFNLPGIPVQYEVESGSLKFVYKLQRYTTDIIPSQSFDAPKAGYRVMTYDENQQLKKGLNKK